MVNILTAVITDRLPAVEAACAEAIPWDVRATCHLKLLNGDKRAAFLAHAPVDLDLAGPRNDLGRRTTGA
jgi:hypothetical protein